MGMDEQTLPVTSHCRTWVLIQLWETSLQEHQSLGQSLQTFLSGENSEVTVLRLLGAVVAWLLQVTSHF